MGSRESPHSSAGPAVGANSRFSDVGFFGNDLENDRVSQVPPPILTQGVNQVARCAMDGRADGVRGAPFRSVLGRRDIQHSSNDWSRPACMVASCQVSDEAGGPLLSDQLRTGQALLPLASGPADQRIMHFVFILSIFHAWEKKGRARAAGSSTIWASVGPTPAWTGG